jgi:NADH:ubiquinone oxidoreductase subunit 2 (subunit N)
MNELTGFGRALLSLFIVTLVVVDVLIFQGKFGQSSVTAWSRVIFGALSQFAAIVSLVLTLSLLPFSSTKKRSSKSERRRADVRMTIAGLAAVALFAGIGWSLMHSGVAHGDEPMKQRWQL